jgi:hypothetical protein
MPFYFPRVSYGRKPHDPAWVSALPPHAYGAAGPAPATLLRTDLTWTPSLVENDRLPTCTTAGLINSARMWSLLNGGFDLTVVEAGLLQFYATQAGCADTTAAIALSDGLRLQDVLEAAGRGLFTAGWGTPLVPLFRAITPITGAAVRDAISQFGSVYLGVTLYQADVQPGAEWKGGIGKAGDPVGGHCCLPWAYSQTSLSVATWGSEMDMNDAFLESRADEAYALTWTMAEAAVAASEGACPRVGDPPG